MLSQEQEAIYRAYLTGFLCTNIGTLLTHPAELMKTTVQVNPTLSMRLCLQLAREKGLFQRYAAWQPVMMRQNFKFLYRSAFVLSMSQTIDSYDFNSFTSNFFKAIAVAFPDTLFSTPLDNIKMESMQVSQRKQLLDAASALFRREGIRGFFKGTRATLYESFGNWFYIFYSYQLLKAQRKEQSFWSEIGTAILATLPIAAATAPFDTLKNLQQTNHLPPNNSTLTGIKGMFQQYGLFAAYRGVPFQVVRRSVGTLIGFALLDAVRPATDSQRVILDTELMQDSYARTSSDPEFITLPSDERARTDSERSLQIYLDTFSPF